MTTYICKCGREVKKSTNADNTGNRDTANCKGCPYLLPWGPFEFVKSQGFVRNVKGYECRMSKDIEYATHFCGSIDDKCSCYIASLDFDFLTRVSNWIKETYPGGELNGSFFTDDIRAVEYVSNGRYRMSIGCAQNKKGIAAKAALLHQFFDESGARLDMTPEEEKAHILAAIEAGKAKAQERKKNMEYTIGKRVATGRLYAYYKGAFWFWDEYVQKWLLSQFAEDLYQERRKGEKNFTREDLLSETAGFYLLDEYEAGYSCIEALLQCNPKTAKTAEKGNPTSSAAATAAAEETAATPEPLDSASMTAAPVAKTSEPTGVVAENALAGADGSTAFDYSGLDDQTVADLHLAEREYSSGKKMAEMGLRRMADAVAIAHNTLCGAVVHMVDNSKHGNRGEDTFRCWCESIGVGKTTAYKMLQVSKLMDDSSPREQKVLEELSPSLLYAAAKPSAPAELVQAVKDGDIATHKQYQEALAEIKARDAKIQELLEMSENSDRRADRAEAKAKKAEQERDAARDAQANLSAMANKFSKQRDAAEQRVEDAERRAQAAEEDAAGWKQAGLEMQELVDQRDERIRELESGITVEAAAVDQEEIERRANELSEPLVKIIDQQNEQIERMASGNTVAAQASVLEQYINSMRASLLSNARRTELACYDVGALDSLAQALREFADEIDGLFEEGEENEE